MRGVRVVPLKVSDRSRHRESCFCSAPLSKPRAMGTGSFRCLSYRIVRDVFVSMSIAMSSSRLSFPSQLCNITSRYGVSSCDTSESRDNWEQKEPVFRISLQGSS